ncbi:MAG: HipA domain-containing protein [Bacteroidales bacterium]
MAKKCLSCYESLSEKNTKFHASCSRKLFNSPIPPILDFTEEQMLELGTKVIKSQAAVTGVQPKLSLEIEKLKSKDIPDRFTIVGLWGGYILKPPSVIYKELPELEDLTMHLAKSAGIETVPHSLIRLKSGTLAYITKRVDRTKAGKIHMEDMCQLTQRLTEHKYQGSYEQIGKAIIQYSENPLLDIINFFEQVIFSFLIGNADMHLKNFSLINQPGIGYTLCPAYDLVPSEIIVEGDDEELALNLNGKKRKISRSDFVAAMERFDIDSKTMDNIFAKFVKSKKYWEEFIKISFVTKKKQIELNKLIQRKFEQLELR